MADTFSALAEEGLITIPGISNTMTWRIALARDHSRRQHRPEFGAWQQQHSIYWPRPGFIESGLVTPEAIDYAADHRELTIMSYSPQQSGQIVRPWLPISDPYNHPGSHGRLRLAHRIAHDHDATANQVIMAWHLAGPKSALGYRDGSADSALSQLPDRRATMLPVLGASSVAQLDEALGTLDVELTADELDELDTV